MNLEESIRRILRESFTGETPNDISQQLVNQPITLTGDLSTKSNIHNVDVNPDGSIVLKLENGANVNIAQSRLRRLNVGLNIPINLKVKKKSSLLESENDNGKYTKAIQGILEYFKNEDCVCDIDMWYDDEDDMYLVYLVFGTEELDDKFTSDGKFGYVRKKQKEVEETIKSYLPIKNIRVGSYGTPHCGWKSLNESETKTNSSLHRLLNMLFDGFDNADYDWANYMCGMGECCDPYAIGFTLPDSDYDDYIFKLVDGEMYDDDADYPAEFRDELPEPCYQQPDLKDPRFDTIVFYGLYAEEIEDYMGHAHNWNLDLLKIINNQFGCDAKTIIII